MKCDHCGQANDPHSTSCRACGRAFAGAARHAERRQVTALFCDLVESVSLTQRLGPEEMMRVVDRYLAICDDLISEHGGNVMQYMGDGVLAYFGYPHANEDDASNAVAAGLRIRDAVGRLELPSNVALQVRIGIATGMVVVSELIGRREARGGGIVGETPNLAARLQSVADPGAVVVGETTQRITAGRFTYRALGGFLLKGFAARVQAFEVVEDASVASRFLARNRGETTPLVGRATELAALVAGWERARGGRGQTILLRGEPGIGKSRLVEELRRTVADLPHIQFSWYCGPNGSDSALLPVSRQLARAAGFERGDDAGLRHAKLDALLLSYGVTDAAGRAVLADLLGLPPEAGTPAAGLTPERRKAVTLDTLLGMMEYATRDRPALFVVEDLHWCDSTTLELLERAVVLAAGRSWLILFTARVEFERGWPRAADVRTIDLDRLDRGNAERICKHLGADSFLSAETVRQIIARCDGVPLFVEEMTRSVLEAVSDASVQDGTQVVAIPASVRDSLVARLDRLGPARRIACLGAAIGRRFNYDLLAAVADRPEAALRQDLRELALSGLVDRSGVPPVSSYLFKHALIRDAAYDSLLKREREALHGRIAAVLRERFPNTRDAEPELLAYHLTESGAAADAIPLWMQAAQHAAARAAHVEAVGHLQSALDLLRHTPKDDVRAKTEMGLRIGLAISLAATRGYTAPEVKAHLAGARAIADALGDIPSLFAVLRGICNFEIVAGELDAAEATARRCIAIGEQTGLPEHRIESHCALGYVLSIKGDLPAAKWHSEQVVQLYADHDGARLPFIVSQDPLIVSLSALLIVLHAMGDDAGVERVDATLTDHARSLGRTFDTVYALSFQVSLRLWTRQFAQALQMIEETTSICAAHGYALWATISELNRSIIQGHLGNRQQAIESVRANLLEQDRLGVLAWRGSYAGELAWLEAEAGDVLTALETVDAAIVQARRSGEHLFLSPLYRRRAAILSRTPGADPSEAEAALRDAIAIARRQGAETFAQEAAAMLEERQGPGGLTLQSSVRYTNVLKL